MAFALGFGMSAALFVGVIGGTGRSSRLPRVVAPAGASPSVSLAGYRLHPGVDCKGGNVLTVYAHQDDYLFFSPDLQRWVGKGACVTIVQLTAGDAGRGPSYWEGRNTGELASFGLMAYDAGKVPSAQPQWSQGSLTVAGHTIRDYTLSADPRVTILMMLLPDGGAHPESLYALSAGRVPSISSLDPGYPDRYTQTGLVQFLTGIYRVVAPDRINTQDWTLPANAPGGEGTTAGGFVGTLSGGQDSGALVSDHADHLAGAKDALAAAGAPGWHGPGPWEIVAYMDDATTANQAGFYDVSPVDYPQADAEKWAAWDVYAVHDPAMATRCPNQPVCRVNYPDFYQLVQGEWIRASHISGIGS